MRKVMVMALKMLSYGSPGDYKTERRMQKWMHPALPTRCFVWDHQVLAKDGYPVPIGLFYPKVLRSQTVVLFFHGGGWVSGSKDTYVSVCSNLAEIAGCRVVSVDYRLAPEHPFPCGLEDCYAAAREWFLHAEEFHTQPEKIVLAGDSAGGNLAAAVSLLAKDRGEFQVSRQVLIYPAVNNDYSALAPFASLRENGEGYLLTTKKIQENMNLYAPDPRHRSSPYFAPLLAKDLSHQPETLILTAEYDPLRDEGEAYGRKLQAFGCKVYMERVSGMLHGFFSLPVRFSAVRRCYKKIGNFLNGNVGERNA